MRRYQITSTADAQQLFAVIKYLEGSIGANWRTILDQEAGGGITLAVCPDDLVLLIIEAKEGETLKRLHDSFLGIVEHETTAKNRPRYWKTGWDSTVEPR
jgi:hypothetical protein